METFGLAITTHNRPNTLNTSLKHWHKHTPPNTPIIVIDDNSEPPHPQATQWLPTTHGIARAKNACIAALMEHNLQHLFLADDDCYPLRDNWWQPWINSPQPHLMATFQHPGGTARSHLKRIGGDQHHNAYNSARGYFLYLHRTCVETVGGMDPRFGIAGWEHVNLSDRIHNAGLTTWRYTDIKNSHELIYSMDAYREVDSSIPEAARIHAREVGKPLRQATIDDKYYVPYT